MNGVHDLGGIDGFGPVVPEPNEPVFHHDWERRVFALRFCTRALRNPDSGRHAIERMPPAEYLASSYYEHWLSGLERGLIESGMLTCEEIEEALRNPREPRRPPAAPTRVAATAAVVERPRSARFRIGDVVVARNLNPRGHTRLPRYVRGHRGTVRHDWGVFTYPDTNARGLGRKPQHCYGVEFTARELWGADRPAGERIFIDLWDDYLEIDRKTPARRPTKVSSTGSAKKPKLAKARGTAGARARPVAKKRAKQARKRR